MSEPILKQNQPIPVTMSKLHELLTVYLEKSNKAGVFNLGESFQVHVLLNYLNEYNSRYTKQQEDINTLQQKVVKMELEKKSTPTVVSEPFVAPESVSQPVNMDLGVKSTSVVKV